MQREKRMYIILYIIAFILHISILRSYFGLGKGDTGVVWWRWKDRDAGVGMDWSRSFHIRGRRQHQDVHALLRRRVPGRRDACVLSHPRTQR